MFKKNLIILSAAFVLLAGCGAATVATPDVSWKEFTPKEAPKVKVLFPLEPTEKTTPLSFPKGVTTPSYSYSTKVGEAQYALTFATYPDSVTLPTDPKELLKNIMNGSVSANSKNELVSSNPMTVGANPALEYTIKQGTLQGTWRYILVGRTLYGISVGSVSDADKQKFFESFSLTK